MATVVHFGDVAKLLQGSRVHFNLQAPELVEFAVARGEVQLTDKGAVVGYTAPRTGRSPKDKFIVRDAITSDKVDWGTVNQAVEPGVFDALYDRVTYFLEGRELFVQDLFCGADPDYRLPIQVINEYAWHNLFVRQLVRPARAEELKAHKPEFTVVCAPGFLADPERDGTNSEVFIVLNFTRRMVMIGGTQYAGEMKKSIFGVMNFLSAAAGCVSHALLGQCRRRRRDRAVLWLSGTGKTTLSADPDAPSDRRRRAWLERRRASSTSKADATPSASGCREKNEPQIWNALGFGCVLENVVTRSR